MITGRTLFTVMVSVVSVAGLLDAQGLGGFIKDRAKERVKQKIAECIATISSASGRRKTRGREVKITEAPETPTQAAPPRPVWHQQHRRRSPEKARG